MPSPGVVSCVKEAVSQLRETNPDLIYMLDPVMVRNMDFFVSVLRLAESLEFFLTFSICFFQLTQGDIGRGMYVNPDVLPIYRSMLPLASVISPNQFEAQ